MGITLHCAFVLGSKHGHPSVNDEDVERHLAALIQGPVAINTDSTDKYHGADSGDTSDTLGGGLMESAYFKIVHRYIAYKIGGKHCL